MNRKFKNAGYQSLALAFMAAMLFAASPAEAAAPSFFTPAAGDKSISEFLVPIFGSLFGSGGGSSPLLAMFGVFNAAALTIGGILAAYTLLAGTMQTAHDGEMLGKRWSSMWLPIRTTLGVGMVVPVSNGYCVAQLLVGWVATQGIGLADDLWKGFANASFSQTGMAPSAASPNVRTLAEQLLKNMVCVEAGNKLKTQGGAAAQIYPSNFSGTDYTPIANSDPMSGAIYDAGPVTGRQYGHTASPSVCGSMSFDSISVPSNEGNIFKGVTTGTADRGTVNAIITAHKTAAQNLETAMQALAVKIVTDGDTYDPGAIGTATAAYQTTVNGAATNLFGSGDAAFAAIKQSATSDGWIMAGAWFMRIAALQDVMSKATSATPTATPPRNLNDDAFKPFYARYTGAIANNASSIGFTQTNTPEDSSGNVFKSAIRSVSQYITRSFKIDENRHPVMAAKDLGDKVMVGSELGILAAGAAILAGGIASLGFAGAALTFAGTVVMALTLPLFAFGAGLSVYIPLIPFIVFFGAALGWLLLVAEAVIAAPLWAVMHLTPSGDDIMGGARQGYMLLLGLLLRPALLIFGFAMCVVGIGPVLKFYNMIFFPVFFASMGDSMVGLFSALVGLGIYFGTMTFFMHKIFGLIHVIPDQLLQWIGGGSSQLGSYGGGASEAGKSSKAAMAGAIAQSSQTLTSAGGQLAQTTAQRKMGADAKQEAMIGKAEGRMDAASTGAQSALKDAGAGASAFDKGMSTGNPSHLADSFRENSQAASTMKERQSTLKDAANDAAQAAGAMKVSSKADQNKKDDLLSEAGALNAKADSMNAPIKQAEGMANQSFQALTNKADKLSDAASQPGASLATKMEAASAAGIAHQVAQSAAASKNGEAQYHASKINENPKNPREEQSSQANQAKAEKFSGEAAVFAAAATSMAAKESAAQDLVAGHKENAATSPASSSNGADPTKQGE